MSTKLHMIRTDKVACSNCIGIPYSCSLDIILYFPNQNFGKGCPGKNAQFKNFSFLYFFTLKVLKVKTDEIFELPIKF